MQLDMNEILTRLESCVTGLSRAAELITNAAIELTMKAGVKEGELVKLTAAVEVSDNANTTSEHELHLERRLRDVESALATIHGGDSRAENRVELRKTLPAATLQLLAKRGIDTDDEVSLRGLDAALMGLSLEHRIAVKSQLLRTGAMIR